MTSLGCNVCAFGARLKTCDFDIRFTWYNILGSPLLIIQEHPLPPYLTILVLCTWEINQVASIPEQLVRRHWCCRENKENKRQTQRTTKRIVKNLANLCRQSTNPEIENNIE